MGLRTLIRLARVRQWYKNLVIFLPIIFLLRLFNFSDFLLVLFGFVALSLVSSANYIINDMADLKSDKKHPEKKNRPLASGKISQGSAKILAAILLTAGLASGFLLGKGFFIALLALFIITTAYSLRLKRVKYIDIGLIGINFTVRAASGAAILGTHPSIWLIVLTFIVASIFALGKRQADNHNNGAARYGKQESQALMLACMACFIIIYSAYALLKSNTLIATAIFAFYTLYRYKQLADSGSPISRMLENWYKDRRLAAAVILWVVAALLSIYIDHSTVVDIII